MTVQFNSRSGSRGIEWADETRNRIGGCFHRCRWEMPDGTTAICYAEQLANNGVARGGYPRGFEHHYWRDGAKITTGSDPLLIFCDSMSDLFGHWVPNDQVTAVLDELSNAPHHTYQSLTKAPGRLRLFLDHLPANLWVGVSSAPDHFMGNRLDNNQQVRFMQRALSALREVRNKTTSLTWMSLEPVSWDMAHLFEDHPLDWVVIGAAMNDRKYFQPDPEHTRKLLDVFDATGTPVFFKGNIKPTFERGFDDPRLDRWREDFPARYRDGRLIPAVLRRQVEAQRHGWTANTVLLDEGVGAQRAAQLIPRAIEDMQPKVLQQGSLF